VIYGHMQAVGMVNDHLMDCFRYHDVRRLGITGERTTRRE
jgi:DNA-3-methyladenine glycosylase I